MKTRTLLLCFFTLFLSLLYPAYGEELNLKKEQTSYDDLLGALRLALKGYNIG